MEKIKIKAIGRGSRMDKSYETGRKRIWILRIRALGQGISG